MSFSYEKWKENDEKRRQQQVTPKITPYEEWSANRQSSSKVNLISQGLTGMSMEEYRKKNPPVSPTPAKEEKIEATVSNIPPKDKESKNIFSKAGSWIAETAGETWDWTKDRAADVKKASKPAFNIALEMLGVTSPVESDVLKGGFKKGNENDTLAEKTGSNLRAGTGDFIKQTGDALKYLGADKTGVKVSNFGKSISDGYGESFQNGREFTWSNLLNPEYYATNVARQVPQMATMVLGGGVGLGVKAATSLTKLPTLAQTIIGVAGGAGAMTTLESAMEAGGVYEEAKQRGMTEEQAKKAADETFKKNLALTGGTSALELGLGMTPLTRGLSRLDITKQLLARGLGGAAAEGVQEGFQEKISTEALGDKFKWTDPSTVEAMVIGGLLGGTTTAGMAGIQAGANATANTRSSLDNIARNTIDSLSNERRAEFDEMVSVHREQGKSFNEAQLDALEDLASRYKDVVETARQSTRSYIDNEKLQRAQNAPVAERLQQEQIARNTMNYEYQNQNNYQFNPAAIADNTNVLPEQYPTGARNLQPQLQNLMAQPQEAATQASVNTSPNANTFNMTIPDMDTTSTAQPQTLRNLQALNSPSAEQSNMPGTTSKQIPAPTKNEAFKDLQTGDEIRLKGTKATTYYTVVEDDGGKSVKVETIQGKTIQVPRSSIEKILMRQSEANVMADSIKDTAITVKPVETNAVQQPEQTTADSKLQASPSFKNKVIDDVNKLVASGNEVKVAVAELRNSKEYQGNPALLKEFDKVVDEEFTSSTSQENNNMKNATDTPDIARTGVQTNLFENESQNSQSSNRAGRATKSSNTDTFVGAKGGKRKQDQVNKGETTRAEIIRYIKDNFNVRVDIGQYRQRAKGVFKNKFAIIRTKDYADFEVIAHELGHRFDMRHGWSSDPSLKREWARFAEANLELPQSFTELQKAKEGVAEYFRQHLYDETQANVDYRDLSDALHDKVNESLEKSKWSKPLENLQGKMLDWMNRDAEQELGGVVAPIGKRKQQFSAKRFIKHAYTWFFEKEHAVFDAIKQIEKETGIKIEGRSNAYQMAVLTRGTVARAATFIKRETFNSITGERTGESLEDILKDVDDIETFGRYLVAKHGLYLIKEKGKDRTPLTPDLMEEYLKNENRYEEHANRIYEYQNRLLDVLVEGNLIPKDLPSKLKEEYPYYVPFYRVMETTGEKTSNLGGGGRSQQYVNQQQGVKRMKEKGSSRNIVNPIESIIRNTHLYFGLADRNAVGVAMAELADPDSEFAAEVTRDIIEEIPSKMKLYEGQLDQIKKTLLDAGLDQDMMEDLNMEETFKVFEPIFKPNSSNNEILVWKDGQPKLYKVHDKLLYNALISYDNSAIVEGLRIIGKPLEISNNVLRSGITASPFFTLRNFVRSLVQVFIKTEAQGVNYVTHPLRVLKAVGSVAESRFRNNDAVTEWWKSGGAQSTFIAVENKYLDKELGKIALNKKAKQYLHGVKYGAKTERKIFSWFLAKTRQLPSNTLHVLQLFNDTLDQSIKLAEYQVVKKQTGNRQKAALASREADVDYKRFGSASREFNRWTLFFNVSLQGPDNIARTFAKHPVRTSVRVLTLITLPTLLLYAINRDDECYQELDSWEKDMNWMIPMGGCEFVKIPIPFELGILFKTIPEKMFGEFLDVVKSEDKQSWDKIYKNSLSTMIPSYLPTLANVVYSYKAEKNLNFGRDFVPKSLQGLEESEQYGDNTSEIMKWLGKKLNKSPITLEETFKSQFGQMGQFSLWAADNLLMSDTPDTSGLKRGYIARQFTSSAEDGGTDSITNFYEVLDKKERAYKTHGQAYDIPADLKLYRDVQKDMSTLRKLRDAMMYNKMLDANGQPFSKEIKKDHVDTINKALRDMARYARFLGEDENITEDEKRKAYENGIMDKDNFQRALQMKDNFQRYQKARDKEMRQEAKLLKLQRQQQNNN